MFKVYVKEHITDINRTKLQARNKVTLVQITFKISPKNIGSKNSFKRAQVEDTAEVSETIRLRWKAGIIPRGKTRSKVNEKWYSQQEVKRDPAASKGNHRIYKKDNLLNFSAAEFVLKFKGNQHICR